MSKASSLTAFRTFELCAWLFGTVVPREFAQPPKSERGEPQKERLMGTPLPRCQTARSQVGFRLWDLPSLPESENKTIPIR